MDLAFLEQAGSLVSLLVWLAFGAISVPIVFDRVEVATVLYAVLSLTLARMVPVALASWRAGLDRDTVLFVGWFGPRGLASLVFALLTLEELGPDADGAVTVIGLTVLMSVVAHGLTASPLGPRTARPQPPERRRRSPAIRSPTYRSAACPATPTSDRHRRRVEQRWAATSSRPNLDHRHPGFSPQSG